MAIRLNGSSHSGIKPFTPRPYLETLVPRLSRAFEIPAPDSLGNVHSHPLDVRHDVTDIEKDLPFSVAGGEELILTFEPSA